MTLSTLRSRRPLWGRIPVASLALLLCTSLASAAAHVKDDASFFGTPAVQQAEQQLAAIQQRGGPNVVIETFDQPPGATRDQIVNAPDPSSRTRAFEQLMDDRAKANGADVYVLVNRTPPQIRVIERKAMQSRGLPAAERDRVASTMRDAFVQKQFDAGLANGVGVLATALGGSSAPPPPVATPPMPTQNAPVQARRDDPMPTVPPAGPTGGATASRGFGGLGCCTIAGIGLLVVLVIAVVRRMGNRNRGGPGYGGANYGGGVPPAGGYPPGGAYPQQGGYPPQAGGGFGRGVAGGVLGGVLGSVLGNQISHGHDNSGQSHGGGGVFGGGDETRGTSQNTDYTSSSGGDFGTANDTGGSSDYTSSSGGDFGGGGGDSGGGGGGDSGGSSGGDF